MPANQDVFAAAVRRDAKILWDTTNRLRALRHEADAADFGNTFVDTDTNKFSSEIGPVIYAVVDAILDTGLAGNIAKLL